MTIFSNSRYGCVAQLVQSSDGTHAVASGFGNLADGRPTTRCAIRWPTKTPTALTDYIEIVVRVTIPPVQPWQDLLIPETRLWCLDGLVGIPPGTKVQLCCGSSPSSLTVFETLQTEVLPNGRIGLWFARDRHFGKQLEYFSFRIFNDAVSSKPFLPGAVVQIGEVFAAPVEEWPASEFEIKPVDLSLSNEASDGTIRRVKRTPQRQFTVTIPPMRYERSLLEYNGGSLQDFLYRLIAADYVAVVARQNYRSTPFARVEGAVDGDHIRSMGFLACLQDAGALKFSANNDVSSALTLTFKESL